MSAPRTPNPQSRPDATPLLSDYAGDPDMAELITEFVEAMPARSESILEAYRTRDADTLKRLTHQLKGSAGGYGFPTVGTAAGAIEHALKTALDPAAALADLDREVRALIDLCARTSGSPSAGPHTTR
jgi:HPt (histidine-containing phosphotransfer) domain-containing protein